MGVLGILGALSINDPTTGKLRHTPLVSWPGHNPALLVLRLSVVGLGYLGHCEGKVSIQVVRSAVGAPVLGHMEEKQRRHLEGWQAALGLESW